MGTAVVAGVLCFLAVNSAQAADQGASPNAAAGHAVTQIIVQPGQTLWSIAEQADPAADARLVVQRIVALNSLSTQNLTAGQHLTVPQG
jgi:nucleoid-associated protein YgaU